MCGHVPGAAVAEHAAETARSDQQQALILHAAETVGKYHARLQSEGVSEDDATTLTADAQQFILATELGFAVDGGD